MYIANSCKYVELDFIVNNGLQLFINDFINTSIRNNGLIETWAEKFLINNLINYTMLEH